MKNINWLIRKLFYKHTDQGVNTRTVSNPLYYQVGYVNQKHANLCTKASESMLYHFGGKPFASMEKNPSGLFEGTKAKGDDFVHEDLSTYNFIRMKQAFKAKLDTHGPFIISLPLQYDLDHAVVLIGHDDNNLIYHDPLTDANRAISFTELHKICEGEFMELAIPNFYSSELLSTSRQTVIADHPERICSIKHAKYFTIDKMENPCQAIKDFLFDYSENSLWQHRNHREEVRKFLTENKYETNLRTLVMNMHNSLPNKGKGELSSRLEAVAQFTNIHKCREFKKNIQNEITFDTNSAPDDTSTIQLKI